LLHLGTHTNITILHEYQIGSKLSSEDNDAVNKGRATTVVDNFEFE